MNRRPAGLRRRSSPLVRLAAAVALAAAAAPAAPAAAARQPKPRPFALEDMVRFREVADLRVSPGGGLVVFSVRSANLDAERYETDLWLAPLDGATPPRQLTSRPGSETSPRWSPDGTRIGFLANDGDKTQVWALPAAGGEAARLTSHALSIASYDWAPDSRRLLVVAPAAETEDEARGGKERGGSYRQGEQWRNHRAWVGEDGRGLTPLTGGKEHVAAGRWSAHGERVALITQPSPEADSATDALVEVVEIAGGARRKVPGSLQATEIDWSPDGRALAFVAPFDGRGISRQDLFVWDPGARESRNLSGSLDRDVELVRWRAGGAVDLLYSRGAVSEVARVEIASGRAQVIWRPGRALDALEPAGEGWAFVRADRPHEVWASGSAGAEDRPLTRLNAGMEGIELPAIEAVHWNGVDPRIEGIVYKPRNHDPRRRYPLVVRPHGGPRLHARAELDPMACYLAARGFVVLRPNFRGSTGYGDEFARGNVENWGDGPYSDMMAGVDHLVAKGIADPDRLFIYGWSYGGYLTNWAIGQTHRFRAAASGAGVADLRMQYVISDARRWRFDYFRGSPFAGNAEIYAGESPITHARLARTPTLFLHGEKDARCPLPQSLMMYQALRDNGVAAELVLYPRAGHDFEEPRQVLDRARRIAEWFARHDLRPGARQ